MLGDRPPQIGTLRLVALIVIAFGALADGLVVV